MCIKYHSWIESQNRRWEGIPWYLFQNISIKPDAKEFLVVANFISKKQYRNKHKILTN